MNIEKTHYDILWGIRKDYRKRASVLENRMNDNAGLVTVRLLGDNEKIKEGDEEFTGAFGRWIPCPCEAFDTCAGDYGTLTRRPLKFSEKQKQLQKLVRKIHSLPKEVIKRVFMPVTAGLTPESIEFWEHLEKFFADCFFGRAIPVVRRQRNDCPTLVYGFKHNKPATINQITKIINMYSACVKSDIHKIIGKPYHALREFGKKFPY
jgi:hypothetical protein